MEWISGRVTGSFYRADALLTYHHMVHFFKCPSAGFYQILFVKEKGNKGCGAVKNEGISQPDHYKNNNAKP